MLFDKAPDVKERVVLRCNFVELVSKLLYDILYFKLLIPAKELIICLV